MAKTVPLVFQEILVMAMPLSIRIGSKKRKEGGVRVFNRKLVYFHPLRGA